MNMDELRYSVRNLIERKLRSGLTVISILIGITAIFALISFGLGIQAYVNQLAEEAGVDKLFVQARGVGAPGTDENFFISEDDVEFVERINGVAEITGLYTKPVEVKRDRETHYSYGMGYSPDFQRLVLESFSVDLEQGRNLREGDTNKIVLGYNYLAREEIFDYPIALGEKVDINGERFEVVGFMSEIGNPVDDANVYFTYEGFERIFPESEDKYGFAMARSQPGVDAQELSERITERLRKHKDQDEGQEDFFVQTFEDALATFSNIIVILNGILFLIALISLIVASVNTMNTMYTAVLERTREIGIMKAIGARNSDIMFIFIAESGMIGMVGGILGVGLGCLIAAAGGYAAAAAGYSSLQPIFPLGLVIGCIAFAGIIGALSGILPARQAAQLKPVDALRYE